LENKQIEALESCFASHGVIAILTTRFGKN